MFNQVGEINVICTNLEASLVFYRDILGFKVTGEERGAVHLDCGGQSFLLLPYAKNKREPQPYVSTTEFSVDLLVNDLKSAYEYLQDKQVQFAQVYQESEGYFVIRDPDGLCIEVVQRDM